MKNSLKLYDTLSRSVKEVVPYDGKVVKVYNCGPTVYWRMHIGNIRAYVAWDLMHRTLLHLGYKVERKMNFTDVGHMSADDDFGEDKMETSAVKSGKTPQEVANHFIGTVVEDFARMNLLAPDGSKVTPDMKPEDTVRHGWLKATDHVEEMIKFNQKIEEGGFTYETDQALYFDTGKYDQYWELSGQRLDEKLVGVRDEVEVDPEKRHPADFVLWMKRKGKYAKHLQHWNSPWGDGFPGWHIECSAMGCSYLGERIDIHTGGVDHISVHHSNERAQNFGALGHEVVGIWVHNEFVVDSRGEKLAKSKGTDSDLDLIFERGFDPMDLRLYFVSINYRQPINFSWEGLESARNSRLKIIEKLRGLKKEAGESRGKLIRESIDQFQSTLADDLNISKALAVLQATLKGDGEPASIVKTVLDMDRVVGLNLAQMLDTHGTELPEHVMELMSEREAARKDRNFQRSDQIRAEIEKLGYRVLDSAEGSSVEKIS